MKLQQLRYIIEIVNNNLNISSAAECLFTSQPGVSKQVRLLEDELGIEIFKRNGNTLVSLTSSGKEILKRANNILGEIESIKTIASEQTMPDKGKLNIATTYTQARYFLPDLISPFTKKYPDVSIHIHQGTPAQISESVEKGESDFAIATEANYLFENLIMLPCYYWNRSILVPKDHPLSLLDKVSIENLSSFKLVTYSFGFTGKSELDDAFNKAGLTPNINFTATDADVIKTYVKKGLGVGVIATMAIQTCDYDDFCIIDAAHLFKASLTSVGFRKNTYLREYMLDFVLRFAPHLSRKLIQQAIQSNYSAEVKTLLSQVDLPTL